MDSLVSYNNQEAQKAFEKLRLRLNVVRNGSCVEDGRTISRRKRNRRHYNKKRKGKLVFIVVHLIM